VITENRILKDVKLEKLNKKYNVKFSEEDFKIKGNDYIVSLDNDDLSYVKDLSKIANIPIGKLFKKDTSNKLILYIILAINFIMLVIKK
jgi:hypothetical protein